MSTIKRIDAFREKGYCITIEGFRGPFNPEDKEDRPYYVHLFLGDTNGPHNPWTLEGVGFGWSIEEALNHSIVDLCHPVTKKKAGEEWKQ